MPAAGWKRGEDGRFHPPEELKRLRERPRRVASPALARARVAAVEELFEPEGEAALGAAEAVACSPPVALPPPPAAAEAAMQAVAVGAPYVPQNGVEASRPARRRTLQLSSQPRLRRVRFARSSWDTFGQVCAWGWKAGAGRLLALALVLIVVRVFFAEWVTHATQALVAASSIIAATGGVAGMASAAAQASTSFISSTGRSGLSIADEMWSGVDLSNMTVDCWAGAWAADSAEVALPVATARLDAIHSQLVAEALGTVSLAVPVVERERQHLEWPQHFVDFAVRTSLAETGHVLVRWRERRVAFEIAWSNPLWAALECRFESVRGIVLERLASTLASLPNSSVAAWHLGDEQMPAVAGPPGAAARRLVRKLLLDARWLAATAFAVLEAVFR